MHLWMGPLILKGKFTCNWLKVFRENDGVCGYRVDASGF